MSPTSKTERVSLGFRQWPEVPQRTSPRWTLLGLHSPRTGFVVGVLLCPKTFQQEDRSSVTVLPHVPTGLALVPIRIQLGPAYLRWLVLPTEECYGALSGPQKREIWTVL